MIDGVRYSFPGDFAKVDADGSLILLGRGSQVINTGGEKIFPEEVEEAVKRVDGVLDCLVIGLDDEKFGQAVTAVASLVDGATSTKPSVIAAVKQTRRLQGAEVGRVRRRCAACPEWQSRLQSRQQLAIDALSRSRDSCDLAYESRSWTSGEELLVRRTRARVGRSRRRAAR